MIHNVSNLGLDCRKEEDNILIIMIYSSLGKLNKTSNSVIYYSKNSLPNPDNIGKKKSWVMEV